ncbi:tRNA-uridine aminocarboxypropyltransferase [Colwellia sp. 4_MG-2023]|uniref:tRNA-uridine aminocarboxypropyltransferase n=1 Tax=unclassified Colwellia TaxID=196834 RepID=UPI0026E2EF32|nr:MULTISPECIES: tRNA-uridine aminocarboxypropyltransferase [unclassified Colwellia]MDO6506543.1 tRNA-uridine aminocarboxypropyltransferase [Colwellia sp. 5_MG-2023]MDO6555030.1 tRNA-uridine aminocarboxypropyltransferase [Colwellia sp. 4_MG-2023]
MKIFLLTHERELHRGTNTGSLAIGNSNDIVERILWERVNPNKGLTKLIENNQALLLYSKGKSSSEVPSTELQASIEEYENIIIIDGTWQESQKIFNHSPYLKDAPKFTLKTTNDSLYKLRANQAKGGLCTIECIIEVLKMKGQDKIASELAVKFEQFNH